MWRVVRKDRDVLEAGRPGGRWDDGTFDVLYTATNRTGALAELHYHLSQGLPVMPSKAEYFVHEIEVTMTAMLDIRRLSDLAALSAKVEQFGQLNYLERAQEYPSSQEVAEVAHFLEYQGILVPSARHPHPNLVIFTGRLPAGHISSKAGDGPIDWKEVQAMLRGS